jgi:hypothetical protein
MRYAGSLLRVVLVVACLGIAVQAHAQGGYYRSYSSYYYPRPYNNTYHGYWRDQGYGFSNQPAYSGFRYSEGYWGAPHYGSGYNVYYPYRGGSSVPYGRPHRW